MLQKMLDETDRLFKSDLDLYRNDDNESVPASTESNRMRVLLGLIVGGILFAGIVIAIVALIISAGVNYKPVPPKPPEFAYNPFVIYGNCRNTSTEICFILKNDRSRIENPSKYSAVVDYGTDIRVKNTTNNFEPKEIVFNIKLMDEHMINIQYDDVEHERWKIPYQSPNHDPFESVSSKIRSSFGASFTDSPFEWELESKSTYLNQYINTHGCKLQYFDKYIEFEINLQTSEIYGMGERISSFVLNEGNYTLWNYDTTYEYGKDPTKGTHGSHPFLLNRLMDGKYFIGLFMRNSNAMQFSFWRDLTGTIANYKMIGGIIDFYIIHEADPDYILKKYHTLIGRPYLVPIWGMGLQQARKGYTLNDLQNVIKSHEKYNLPIDAVWADETFNDNGKVFTINKTAYEGIGDFVRNTLHNRNMHFVVIVNPFIKEDKEFPYYMDAEKHQCLLMSARYRDQDFVGKTYANKTVWLDYTMDYSQYIWVNGLKSLSDEIEFDGVWMSMNEPTQLCDGECIRNLTTPSIPIPVHDEHEFNNLQYRPTIDPLEKKTLPMSAYHDDINNHSTKHYFTHNLFGLETANITHTILSSILEGKRFLLASRSTFAGSGHFASHWVDKNFATWSSLNATIPAMLNFNMFGIPHVGSPIGGFYGNVSYELYIRWFALASFSPLMLFYSESNISSKEAYTFENSTDIIRNLLITRYRLIRFMYTKMFESFVWGGSVIHPLFFDFTNDESTYDREVIDGSFMWGSTLYVIPVLNKGQKNVRAYLPNWRWYDLKTYEIKLDYREKQLGEYFIFYQPVGEITVLLKGGSIIPYQIIENDTKIKNVMDLEKTPLVLIVAPDHKGKATGSMIVDSEGTRPEPESSSNTYRHYGFTYMNNIFRINKIAGFEFGENYEFEKFTELIILDTNGQTSPSFACYMDMYFNRRLLSYKLSEKTSTITIKDEHSAKISMQDFESIIWGTPEQHNFCGSTVFVTGARLSNEDKTLMAELKANDSEHNPFSYELVANLVANSIISLQIYINDPKREKWIVPGIISDEVRRLLSGTTSLEKAGFRIAEEKKPFYFELNELNNIRSNVFTSQDQHFAYTYNFIHLPLLINSKHIFGLGERIHKFELTDGIYSLFCNDQTNEDDGIPPGNNMWSSHPFYLYHLNNKNRFAANFFLNSNPMDVKIRHENDKILVDHIMIGGIIDAYFIQGNSAEEVLEHYHFIIGRPGPLPYWAFGYHQSRWGYKKLIHVENVVKRFNEENIPLDGLWLDKDYMDNERDFTINRHDWSNLIQFVNGVHEMGIKFIVLVDPALAIDDNYAPYAEGKKQNIFVISNITNNSLVGVSWPGYSVYVDFYNPSASTFWDDCLETLHKETHFDGIWLDMNEPSNFCDGECPDGTHYKYYNFPLDFYDDLYYNPTHRPLGRNTISMESRHHGGTFATEFNYHNMYGLTQSRATANYFTLRHKTRPFVLSSSTFPSSGTHAGHWAGDNYATYEWMMFSIPSIFNFQMFGIPFTGADVCGFRENCPSELCSRWMQLAAFYPMMRNHNSKTSEPQEPYVDPLREKVSKHAIRTRYSLARYIYTAHMKTVYFGGVYFRPVMFDFPTDDNTYEILDETFMFGPGLKMTPVLSQGETIIKSYFPNYDWYDYFTLQTSMTYNPNAKQGGNLTLDVSFEKNNLNLHIKGGNIIPAHSLKSTETALRITQMQNISLDLIVAPHLNSAVGYVYFDNDTNFDYKENAYHYYKINYSGKKIKFDLAAGSKNWTYTKNDDIIGTIKVLRLGNLKSIRCAKMMILNGTEIVLKHEAINDLYLAITANPGTEMRFSNIKSVEWYENNC